VIGERVVVGFSVTCTTGFEVMCSVKQCYQLITNK